MARDNQAVNRRRSLEILQTHSEFCSSRAGTSEEVLAPLRGPLGGTDRTILVVEVDVLIRNLVVEWLLEAGYVVQCAADANGGAKVTLIIAGLAAPNRERATPIEALRMRYPAVPILLISGWFRVGLHGSCEAARGLGVSGVLSIPFSREELLGAVGEVLESVSCAKS
jgi:CheY-like chemotaxis protein